MWIRPQLSSYLIHEFHTNRSVEEPLVCVTKEEPAITACRGRGLRHLCIGKERKGLGIFVPIERSRATLVPHFSYGKKVLQIELRRREICQGALHKARQWPQTFDLGCLCVRSREIW
jgi:hypothetical protein